MTTPRVNERISAYRVRLILADGTNKGEILKAAALEMAKRDGLDLVEVAPGATPVCRIMDYGKMLYERKKKARQSASSGETTDKEIRFSYGCEQHDLDIKKKKIAAFLADGHNVVVSMKLKGREKYVAKGSAARDKFISIVKEFSPSLRESDIRESGKGFIYWLKPTASNS